MRIGIILTGDYGWAGGVYYSLNVIKLLQDLSTKMNIRVVVIANSKTPADLLQQLKHPKTEISFLDNKPFYYKLFHKLLGSRFIADINGLKLDVLFPIISYEKTHKRLNCKCYYWLYDFQHKFLPELFSPEEIKHRDHQFTEIAANGANIVFSSYDSQHHFDTFFPNSKAQKHVFNFVSLLEKDKVANETTLSTPDSYFIVCNQFWPHKNHLIVLKALAKAIKINSSIHVVFTGKFDDQRNKTYVEEIQNYIHEYHLNDKVTFTGFISRDLQVTLMQKAKAIIQPSFFEGWSTVVEDTKALNQFLIASDIEVNKEQVKKNVFFFSPHDDQQLCELMLNLNNESILKTELDYSQNIEKSKSDLIKIFRI
jgi:glycosyltransferase involved in cell wall biosynthesis